ncbi:MAG: hypothetical protein DMG04_21545 [Acidobacteria bacterium]|nr:MAG: hypothetical protein DMG04_21545 [Acidobacteriota bacterium]PYQ83949.1 MAG: hypothetical protein DMG02_32600 [Acidobacteriota bacterium]
MRWSFFGSIGSLGSVHSLILPSPFVSSTAGHQPCDAWASWVLSNATASAVDRAEVRRPPTARSGPAPGHDGDSAIGGADGNGESRLGLHTNPGSPRQPGSSRRTGHHREHPQAAWDRAGAGASAADDLAGVLETHWDVLAAADFFTVEVWTCSGLTRFAVLFVIELATRRVEITGVMSEPDSAWVLQCGRQVTDAVDGFLIGKHFLLHDRDPLFGDAFRETLAAAGVQTVRLPPRSPNLNAFAERFVRTIKESCLDRVILMGEASLRRAIREFVAHYHGERNHQGLQNQLITRPVAHRQDGPIACRDRLGGLLKYYHRPAA